MIPSELRLTSLGHCYVHLPETFVSNILPVKGGAVVSIKSIQNEREILVMWDGQLTPGEHVELDHCFGRANKFTDELVIISSVGAQQIGECSSCRVELLDPCDFAILSQHSEANLLDTCRLVTRNLVVPIFVAQHVKVLVRVAELEPRDRPQLILSKGTQLSYVHELAETASGAAAQQAQPAIGAILQKCVPYLRCSLGADGHTPNLHLGSMLICGQRGSGKTHSLKKILQVYNGQYFNCKQLRAKRPESVKRLLGDLLARAQDGEQQAAIVALDDVDSLLEFDPKRADEQGQEVAHQKRLVAVFCHFLKQLESTHCKHAQLAARRKHIILVATCRSSDSLDQRISSPTGRKYFTEIVQLGAPDLQGRIEILSNLLSEQVGFRCALRGEPDLAKVAERCASFMASDLKCLFERALIAACARSSSQFSSELVALELSDFLESIDGHTPINLRAVRLQPKSQLSSFERIGGMADIKLALHKTVLLPLRYPRLYSKFALKAQNSVLLYGPSGCGKTMIAKALLNRDDINSICVRGPELLSKYIGASEAAVRNLFEQAQLAKPCVVFFDDFESLVARRGKDSTGVTDRIVNQFLTILDGVDSLSRDVFIIAATSRPDMIDPAMLRPGRIDKHIYCPLPDEHARLEILHVLRDSVKFDADVDLAHWAHVLDRFTGADMELLVQSALVRALKELLAGQRHGRGDGQQLGVQIRRKHLQESYEEMAPVVHTNYNKFSESQIEKFYEFSKQRVAVRATLA